MARHPVIDPDRSAVALDQDLHQVQPEPLAAPPLLLLVAVEDLLLPVVRDTTTGPSTGNPTTPIPT
jgi:hypothetical protein